MARTSPTGPSDPGLAGERTSLAWARIGLALLAVPSGLVAYAVGRGVPVTLVTSVLATITGLGLLVSSLRRQRAEQDMVGRGGSVLASRQVLLAAATVVLVNVAGLELVLTTA